MIAPDAYDGIVHVDGPPQTRLLAELTITKIAVGPYDNNAYVLRCTATGEVLLIDAAATAERLLPLVDSAPRVVVLTTHGHADHWQALAEVVAQTGARTMAGRLDAPDIPVPTDQLLDHGDAIEFGAIRLRAVHLQGHTPGSIVAVYDDPQGHPHVFTGDCLFPGGVGKTWDDPQRFATLYAGVVAEIFDPLPDSTWIYPGHGRDTTVGRERPRLAEWAERGW